MKDTKTFESALSELSEIVKRLEDGRENLEASMADFEKGAKLVTYLEKTLGAAETKIEKLIAQLKKNEATCNSEE